MSASSRTPRPPTFRSVRWEPRIYPGTLSQASRVRTHVRTDLKGFPDDAVDSVELCCSELFANAVSYTASGTEGGEVVRRLCLHRPDTLRLHVTDSGWTSARPAVPTDRTAHDWAEAEGQRGLLLIDSLARRWGYFPVLPHPSLNLGLCVWADLPVDPAQVPRGLEPFIFTA
ncbi:ATP-binding protein [Nocardiopsis suaedae]|uniref:ATP-binding protein n=1 Tax=Nocardiopsis suaedae TaxID=3018444 RepID=A0ABT4TGV1_9ACTN|nr:ATP-binding protein [Nocardiopsis suaedae]MDA2803494.1 ATP-binding protein [Nocardiopsis suaedae]